MKNPSKLSACLAAGLLLFAAGCNLPDADDLTGGGGITDPDNFFSYGVKSGYIVYKSTNVYESETTLDTFAMYFDEYGKKFRTKSGSGEVIIDGVAGKMYTLDTEEKVYVESDVTPGAEMAYGASLVYLGDDLNSAWGTLYAGFSKKPNKTIAGKNCSMVGWSEDGETTEWGGWSRITFWLRTADEDKSSTLEAISFTESIPAGSFAPPADYTKMNANQGY